MHLSISNSVSFLTLSLLALQPFITNGYPIRDLMSRGQNKINSTHIPFPILLIPSKPANPIKNLLSHVISSIDSTHVPFPIFLHPVSVSVTFSEIMNGSTATAIPTATTTVITVATGVPSHVTNRRNDAEAETKEHTYDQPLQAQRKDFISTITKQFWDSIGEMMRSYSAEPTVVHGVVNITDEKAKNGTNGSVKDRRMYGEGCLWGEWKDC